MFLKRLEIKNFRSLEHVVLDDLGHMNVIVGRNNTGKSTILGALMHLRAILSGSGETVSQGNPVPHHLQRLLTAQDLSRHIEMRLTFSPSQEERRNWIDVLPFGDEHTRATDRRLASQLLTEVEYFFRSAPGVPWQLNLARTSVRDEDGKVAVIQETARFTDSYHQPAAFTDLSSVISRRNPEKITSSDLEVSELQYLDENYVRTESVSARDFHPEVFSDPPIVWIFDQLKQFMVNSFFFSPYRRASRDNTNVYAWALNFDGSNLIPRLHTIATADNRDLAKISRFLTEALPEIGLLQTPITPDGSVVIDFISPHGNIRVPLEEVGGGVEQLLMIATVLTNGRSTGALFIEEPESHLHPGAQRFVQEMLAEQDRQVFITTHSSAFVNQPRPPRVYRVALNHGRSEVASADDSASLGSMLGDIGARNSDVLLSDAVLFVEGPSDRDILLEIALRLNRSLPGHGVTVVPIGGGREPGRQISARSELLEAISKGTPVPHLFVFDRDQRGSAELDLLQRNLKERAHVLRGREIENYLLHPSGIKGALTLRFQTDRDRLERVQNVGDDEIQDLVRQATNQLFNDVVMKRIRSEIGGLPGGFLDDETLGILIPHASEPNLPSLVVEAVDRRVQTYTDRLALEELVDRERSAIEIAWTNEDERAWLAPGADILTSVFRSFDARYRKTEDGEYIARTIDIAHVDQELVELIDRAVSLQVR